MKKLYLLILTLFLFISCYFIYRLTLKKQTYYFSIGNFSYSKSIDKNFVNADYRTIDLLNILKYNQEVNFSNTSISIHQLLNKTDVLIICIGDNDINYVINHNIDDKYKYINSVVKNLENIFKIINNYNYEKVLFMGFYNIYGKENDDFINYCNYMVRKICLSYGIKFIDLYNFFDKNANFKSINDEIYEFLVEKS